MNDPGCIRLACLLVVAGMLGCATARRTTPPQEAQLTRALAAPQRLDPPESLPEPARLALRERMTGHARNMGTLMSAIMVLDYFTIRERAAGMADDDSLTRPLKGDSSGLAAALPDTFFELHEEMRTRAGLLRDAAEMRSALDVSNAYGQLATTCVNCHSVYRAGR